GVVVQARVGGAAEGLGEEEAGVVVVAGHEGGDLRGRQQGVAPVVDDRDPVGPAVVVAGGAVELGLGDGEAHQAGDGGRAGGLVPRQHVLEGQAPLVAAGRRERVRRVPGLRLRQPRRREPQVVGEGAGRGVDRLGQGGRRGGGEVGVAGVARRDGVAAHRQGGGGEEGGPAGERGGANRGRTVPEGHRAGRRARAGQRRRDRGRERHRLAGGGRVRRRIDRHRRRVPGDGHRRRGEAAAGEVGVAAVAGRDGVAADGEGGDGEGRPAGTERDGPDRRRPVLERYRPGRRARAREGRGDHGREQIGRASC